MREIVKKVGVSIFAQVISLLVSFVINLIVPKFISEYSYSYWQTYLLYVNYVGVLHFGLLDGIVLRYSQYDYHQLDKSLLRSQYRFLFGINVLFSFIFVVIGLASYPKVMSKIIILVGIGIITKNAFGYTSYLFQMTNRIAMYAKLVIIQRLVYGVTSLVLIAVHNDNFVWFCVADLMGDLIGVAYGLICNKELYIGKVCSVKKAISELKHNLEAGIKLMFANWSSMLLVGLARIMIQLHWDELIFGKVSFSFSLTNLFLTFITAISVVLFPSLKRMNGEELPQLYLKLRNILSPFFIVIMIFYFPGCWILSKWLPNYSSSLVFLGYLLPMIIFSSKTGLLTDNYLKAYRKEKQMLFVNMFTLGIAIVGFAISIYFFHNVNFLLIWVVVSIMIKSMLSELLVMKIIEVDIKKEFIYEIIMTVGFVCTVQFFSLPVGCILYIILCFVYLLQHKEIWNHFK